MFGIQRMKPVQFTDHFPGYGKKEIEKKEIEKRSMLIKNHAYEILYACQ